MVAPGTGLLIGLLDFIQHIQIVICMSFVCLFRLFMRMKTRTLQWAPAWCKAFWKLSTNTCILKSSIWWWQMELTRKVNCLHTHSHSLIHSCTISSDVHTVAVVHSVRYLQKWSNITWMGIKESNYVIQYGWIKHFRECPENAHTRIHIETEFLFRHGVCVCVY